MKPIIRNLRTLRLFIFKHDAWKQTKGLRADKKRQRQEKMWEEINRLDKKLFHKEMM